MNLKDRAKKLKNDIPIVYLALKDKETPIIAKSLALLTIAYALSPIDLIPDFIPVLGYLDDIILLPFLIMLTIKLIPKHVYDKCRQEAVIRTDNRLKKKWYYAVPILLFWLLILIVIVNSFI